MDNKKTGLARALTERRRPTDEDEIAYGVGLEARGGLEEDKSILTGS